MLGSMDMQAAAELVDQFLSLEQELDDVRSQLNEMGVDPYSFDLAEQEETNAAV